MTDVKALHEELKEKGIDSNIFFNVEEEKRKKMLGEFYQETRAKHQWVYDQPISEAGEKERAARLKREQEQAKENERLMKEGEAEQAKQLEARRKELQAEAQKRKEAEEESQASQQQQTKTSTTQTKTATR